VRETTVARSYAEALFALGERRELHDSLASSLAELEAALEAESLLRSFLASPKIDAGAKKDVLRNALQNRAHPLFLNFMMVLIDKRRQRLLLEVGREYRNLLDERRGRLHVQVTLARSPDERTQDELTEKLSASLGREVIPHINVNPEILGGVIVRYGDNVLDGSLRRRMLSMRRRLLEAGLPTNP
jgi:F-type H+-transporting ATPase subunit delta